LADLHRPDARWRSTLAVNVAAVMRGWAMSRAVVLALVLATGCASDGESGARSTATSTLPSTTGAGPDVLASALDGATVPAEFTLVVDVDGASAAKLVTDGAYAGAADEAPLHFSMALPPGEHTVRVRADVDGEEVRIDARFAVGEAPAVSMPPPTVPTSATDTDGTVDTADEIRAALADAAPGEVIVVADGEYQFDQRLVASASGTPTDPITLRGTRAAVLRTKNPSGDYGLHITGDHWVIEGLTVAHATKGIVLDGSVGTVIDGVEVYDIGDEGVHFRSCSSDGVLRNSHIHDTGRNSPQYGEGIYVGSANSNWDKYACSDEREGVAEGDNTERIVIEDNLIEDTTAEGADLKEGTDSGVLRGNTFRRVGGSGKNSADSAVDAKGNGWLIEGNVVSEADAPWDDDGTSRPSEFADAFQTHEVYDGYGTDNVFRANRVEGEVPGFGVGMYPALDNVVGCDNEAPLATAGLVGDNGRSAPCTRP
jgi:hypothetical protein